MAATRWVFIHGYMDDSETWDRLIAALCALGRVERGQCLAVQLHEVCPEPAGSAAALEAYRDEVIRQMRTWGVTDGDGVVLVGHSMGGAVAELVALADVAVQALVLLTPVALAGAHLPPPMLQRFADGLTNRMPASMLAARRALSVALDDDALAMMLRTGSRVSPRRGLQQLLAWDGGHPAGVGPSALSCPVLMVTTDDPFFSRQALEALAQRFRRYALAHVPGAGHWCHVEAPQALAALLSARTH